MGSWLAAEGLLTGKSWTGSPHLPWEDNSAVQRTATLDCFKSDMTISRRLYFLSEFSNKGVVSTAAPSGGFHSKAGPNEMIAYSLALGASSVLVYTNCFPL